jgi:phage shock protein PspC (stress-responsive transcriptional regulator)
MNRTFPRQTANTIAALCILLNCLGVLAYLATLFNWNLSPEKAVDGDELMDPVPLLMMVGCACVILLTIVLQMTGMRLVPSAKSAQNVVRYLGLFGLVLYLVTAVCFPRHPLRFNGSNVEVNDGKWMQIQPADAERIFRQNIRRNIGALIFFGNIAMNWFVLALSVKPKESSDESSSSDGIFGVKKRTE